MGLHITKSIVEQFQGKVGVHSELGKGSTFYFNFILNKNEDNLSNKNQNRLLNERTPVRTVKLVIELI